LLLGALVAGTVVGAEIILVALALPTDAVVVLKSC